jgi:hypothetical protein
MAASMKMAVIWVAVPYSLVIRPRSSKACIVHTA